MRPFARFSLEAILTLCAIGIVAWVQWQYDAQTTSFVKEQHKRVVTFSEPLIPTTNVLKLVSLGDRPLAADLIWLSTIQYFGQGNPYGKYAALGPMLDRITQLDPQFEYPYQFATVVLPFMDQAPIAATIGERGQTAIPNNGLLTYYLASIYQLNLKDYKKAAKYYIKASEEPGAPSAAKILAGISYAHQNKTLDDRLVAIQFWDDVRKTAKNEDDKKRAETWETDLTNMYTLEKVNEQYKKDIGHFAGSLSELQQANYIQNIPTSPSGRTYLLDSSTGKASLQNN